MPYTYVVFKGLDISTGTLIVKYNLLVWQLPISFAFAVV